MIPILYEKDETLFITNGLGRLRDTISFRVTEERNGIYEAVFEYPVDGAHFDDIQCGRIVYATHDDTKTPQPFDIVGYSKPINGVVTFHAVHVSYRLTGIVSKAKNINSLDDAFRAIVETAQPSDAMVFNFSADFTGTGYMAAFDGIPRSARQLLGGVEGSILDTYGGEYEWDRFGVRLHKSRGQQRGFSIRYGVNMLDYQDDTDYLGTFSSCIPYWVGNVNGTDTIVTGDRVDSGQPLFNGRNDCQPLDLSDKFENKPTQTQLTNMAKSVMASRQTNLPSQTIKVDFVRLQDMAGYEQFESLLQCNLCDTINVVFPRYGMQGAFKIVRTVYDTLADRYEEMELGNLSTTLAEALGIQNNADTLATISDLTVNDLAVTGNASISGTVDAANILKNGKNYIAYQTFNFTVGFSAGTVGTRGYQGNTDASLDGYTPIGVSVISVGASASYIPVAFLSGNTLYFNAYRATASAVSNSACTARVIYRKY